MHHSLITKELELKDKQALFMGRRTQAIHFPMVIKVNPGNQIDYIYLVLKMLD
jgi:hypothetical protein